MYRDPISLARELRQRQTDAERKLWSRLRDRRLKEWKFKRQMPCGPYVLDFFCGDAGLVVEVDGIQHAAQTAEHDRRRTEYLEREGLRVVRVWNNDVLARTDSVVGAIYNALGARPAPSPGAVCHPLPKGRGQWRQ